MEIKDSLAQLRKDNHLTQDELAEKLFVTRQAVSRWENGETTPNIDTLKALSQEFGVTVDVILGGAEPPICQSCGMDLRKPEDLGTEGDGGVSVEYCSHCRQDGSFTHERSLDEMVETNLKFLDEYNKEKGLAFSEEEARSVLKAHLATLKRWQQN